jgi:hypothetical protein
MHRFPDGKRFAFTVFDDTDNSTVQNVGAVYRLLDDLGMRTTKSVWALPNVAGARFGGANLHDRDYLNWILGLQNKGFEIALHNVRNSDSPRAVVERGFVEFENRVGNRPRIHVNHSSNRENIYWGDARLNSASVRLCYNLGTRFRRAGKFFGHVENSDFFWGDICKEKIEYVRNFVFNEINLDRVNPLMPYHDLSRPFVKLWFSSCEGARVDTFCETLRESNQDKLEAEGGVCIMYTHFAVGFCNGTLHPRFEELMRRLAAKDGWFVPVSTLLDLLRAENSDRTISGDALTALERRWFLQRAHLGTRQ